MRGWLAGLFVLGGLLAGSAASGETCVPDELLVKFRPGTSPQARSMIHRAMGAGVRNRVQGLDVEVVGLPHGLTPARAATLYARHSSVQYAEPNGYFTPTSIPSDPSYGQEWGLERIQAPAAWDVTAGRPDVRIAILDSGIDMSHEDLAGKIVASENFTPTSTRSDRYGHGTHVAGIAAAATNNGVGIAGVGFNCSLMNVKVYYNEGAAIRATFSAYAEGITWAASNGARVILMSFGTPTPSATVEDAVNFAWNRGAVLVASAGNNGTANLYYPAAYENCIAVAATDANDGKPSWSGFGPWVDVAAPGVGIFSTLPNEENSFNQQGYGSLNGTSQAAAFVAGLAGLVWSAGGGSNAAVRARIESTCDPIAGTGQFWVHGRINAARAVGAIQ
jgi:thermitase